MKLTRLLLALLVALPSMSWAGAGTTPLEFLSLDSDARAVALGGAYSALANDANALRYNPGGLAFIPRNEAVFMHNQYFEGVSQEYAAFALRRGLGAQITYLTFGDIPKTTIANKTGAGLGSYGISDMAVSGGWGRQVLRPGLGAGVALKYVRETIETVSADGLAFDGGLLYDAPELPGLRLAGVLRNFGPPIRYQREAQNLPLEVRLGGAYTFAPRGQETTFALDVAKPRGNDPEVSVGLESVLAGRLPLRLGYDMRNDAGLGLTAGFGWLARDFRVDYAFVSFGELGSAHRISAAWRWGPGGPEKPAPQPQAEAPAPVPVPVAKPPARHYLLQPVPVKAEPVAEPAPAPAGTVAPTPAPPPEPLPPAAPQQKPTVDEF
ncbi:PorV/PorQ family protein [bacterium]|nr:MAG: PorV/PorQ family protein [bacterium]